VTDERTWNALPLHWR